MINILFGGNNKAFKGILLCLLSAIKHTSSPLNVYVLTADLTEINNNYNPITTKQIELLNKVIQEKNKNSKVKLIKLNKNFNNWVMSSKNKFTFYTPKASESIKTHLLPLTSHPERSRSFARCSEANEQNRGSVCDRRDLRRIYNSFFAQSYFLLQRKYGENSTRDPKNASAFLLRKTRNLLHVFPRSTTQTAHRAVCSAQDDASEASIML